MSSRNVTVIILECLALCCALLVVGSQAKYTHWIHRHRHGVQVESPNTWHTERQDPIRQHVMSGHHLKGQHRRHHGDNVDETLIEKPRSLALLEKQNRHLRILSSFRNSHAIKKRHNLELDEYDPKDWEFNVDNLTETNSPICDYDIEPIVDPSVPKDFVRIKCKKDWVGRACPHVNIDTKKSCCTQLVRNIKFNDGEKVKIISIEVGCICSSQDKDVGNGDLGDGATD